MQNVLRLTNYDDWEGYYLLEDDTWVLKEQGHRVRIEDVLNLFGISIDEYEFDFDETGCQAPPVITGEIMNKIWESI